MRLVVLDTNVIVSAFWSRNGAPARVVDMVLCSQITPCFDHRILYEYREVLSRPKFGFSQNEIRAFLDWFETVGLSLTAAPSDIPFTDESDKKFYEVAKNAHAILVTGNLKHFPKDPCVMSVAEFLSIAGK